MKEYKDPDNVFIFRDADFYEDRGAKRHTNKEKKIYGVNDHYIEFQINDKVQIINTGGVYSSYTAMARAMGLSNWKRNKWSYDFEDSLDGAFAQIEAIRLHESQHTIVIGLTLLEGGYAGEQVIIDDSCLEFIKHGGFITDEDIEI
jgi:hypothetical protein